METTVGIELDKVENCEITLEKVNDNTIIFFLNGYIDSFNFVAFEKQVQKVISLGFLKLIFSFERISYIASSGIGAIHTILKSVKEKNGDLVIYNPINRVYDIFSVLGFISFFNILTKVTQEDAIKCISTSYIVNNKLPTFPKVISCMICLKKLKAVKTGIFRCPDCKTVLGISEKGEVSIR